MKRADEQTEQTLYMLGWAGVAIMVMAALVCTMLNWHPTKYMLPCLLHEMTGYYCPGCGGTRAVGLFFTGHFVRSFLYYPLVPIFFVMYALYMVTHMIARLQKKGMRGHGEKSLQKIPGDMDVLEHQKRKRTGMPFFTAYLWIALAVVIINCVVKNLVLWQLHIALIP